MLSPYPIQKTRGANAFRMPRYLGKTYIVDILETMTSQARRRQPWIRGSQKPWDIAESPPPAPLPKHALLGRCCWHPPWPANRHLSIKTRTWIWCWEVINLELNCWTWRSRRSREIWEISCGKNLVKAKALKGNANYDGMSKVVNGESSNRVHSNLIRSCPEVQPLRWASVFSRSIQALASNQTCAILEIQRFS